jgi:hypothetical protein
MHGKFWSENQKGRDHFEDTGIYGRTILKWLLGKQGKEVWTGCM